MQTNRSHVEDVLAMMPMRVKVQREGDKWIAVMPGWQLPSSMIVAESISRHCALTALEEKMKAYWGRSVPPNYK